MSGVPLFKGAFSTRSVFCCLGIALLITSNWATDLITALPSGMSGSAVFTFSGIVCVATFAFWTSRTSRLETLNKRANAIIGIGALAVTGRLLEAFGAILPAGIGFVCAGIIAYSVCESTLMLMWLNLCCRHESRHAPVIFPAAFVITACSYFILLALDAWVTTCVMAALPLLSAAILAKWTPSSSSPSTPQEATEDNTEDTEARWSFPFYPVALMVVYNFVFYFSLALTDGPSPYGSLGMLAVGLGAIGAATLFSNRYSPTLLYKPVLPLMVAGLLLLAYLGFGKSTATLLTNASSVVFGLFIFIILTQQCHRYGMNAIWMFGIVKAYERLANVVGMASGDAFVNTFPAAISLVVSLIIVAMILLSAALFNDRVVAKAFGTTPLDADGHPTQAAMSYYEQIIWECEKTARRYELTKREEEVLELLIQGTPLADIAEKLYISHGTAKTHVNHIYKKLDVHSREEARKIVSETGARKSPVHHIL
jgi:DNA-binding CsgD family transcriptional regulator